MMEAQITHIVETFRRNVSNKNPIFYAVNTDARWTGRDKYGQCPPGNCLRLRVSMPLLA